MKNKTAKTHTFGRVVGRIFAMLGVTLAVVLLTAVGCVALLCKGPSQTAKTTFVSTVCQHQETAWIPTLFLSKEEIKGVLDNQEKLPATTLEEIFPFFKR